MTITTAAMGWGVLLCAPDTGWRRNVKATAHGLEDLGEVQDMC